MRHGRLSTFAGDKAAKALSPVDVRALSWLTFSRCCLDTQLHSGSQSLAWDAAAFAATAAALARQPPRTARLDCLSVQVPHDRLPANTTCRFERYSDQGCTVVGPASPQLPSLFLPQWQQKVS